MLHLIRAHSADTDRAANARETIVIFWPWLLVAAFAGVAVGMLVVICCTIAAFRD